MSIISKETFLAANDPKNRDAMLYDFLQSIDTKLCQLQANLQKRKNKDTAISIGAGFLGGFSAIAAKLAIWK